MNTPAASHRVPAVNPAPFRYTTPPAGAPHVVMIVLDDVGFAQLGCFGSSIATPTIDALAARGLRYNRFHVTSICSSTRACLLTGRNHHVVGVGMTQETSMIYPGYTGRIPPSAALIPRLLRDQGYNTFAVGKWHLAAGTEYSAAGPTERWPLRMGFDRFYGFLGAETSQWTPDLVRDNTAISPPRTPEEGYHLTEDLVDQAITMIQDQQQAAPGKPFFLYLATGAAHAPHQVPREWIERYRGHFDRGWEVERAENFARQVAAGVVPPEATLTERPSWVPDWETLSDDERRVYARYMEVFAGFVTHTDHHLGRLVSFLEQLGVLDDTVVMVLSDNGASSEGGVTGTLNETAAWMGTPQDLAEALAHLDEMGGHRQFNHYPWGWAWAGNAPFPLWKRYSWLGGVRTPLVVHWPAKVDDAGAVRSQFCHANDLGPTLLDLIGIEPPAMVDGVAQQRFDGTSMAASLTAADSPEHHRLQYFEMHGSRAIYHDGWKATTDFVSPLFGERNHLPGSSDHDTDRWSLFDLTTDFAEAHDLADVHPELTSHMEQLWWAEAGRNQVLPLFEGLPPAEVMHPGEYPRPDRAVYRPGGGPVSEARLPALVGGFAMTASVSGESGMEGTLCALGDRFGGFSFHLLEGRPVADFVVFGNATRVESGAPVAAGDHRITLRYNGPRSGMVELVVDDEVVGEARLPIPPFFPGVSTAAGGMYVGRDHGFAVSDDHTPPFPFTGTLHELVIESTTSASRRAEADRFNAATRAD